MRSTSSPRRRCWRAAPCGRSPRAKASRFERPVRRSRAGHRRGRALGRAFDRARCGGAAQGARPLSVRLLRADHQPRAAAALCQRARERGASRARHRGRPAHPRRHRPAAGAPGLQRLVRPVVGRRRRRLARRLCHRLPDAGARARLRGAGRRPSSWRSTGCATSSATRRSRARTAAAISPMRSMCWRATARRRSATCAISPTPSSTTSRRRSPRRRSPRRSGCSATARAPSASIAAALDSIAAAAGARISAAIDYGSSLRDAAALVTLASEGSAPRPTDHQRGRADRGRARR